MRNDEDETLARDRVFDRFLERLWADLEAGGIRDLADYLREFPGDEARIEAEYHEVRRAGDETEGNLSSPGPDADAVVDAGRRIGPFALQEELGRGGQAVVWRARDTRLPRQVALKLVKGLGPDAGLILERFRREAAITSRLEDPGICPIYEVGDDPVPWIAMRLVEGMSLARWLKRRREDRSEAWTFVAREAGDRPSDGPDTAAPLRPAPESHSGPATPQELRSVIGMIERVARALHVAHEAGVIHRDVKPGNIMIGNDGQPVVLDFGLARHDDSDDAELTRTGDVLGTPAYMSPEQISGTEGPLDRRTDVFSLGVTLYECLCGTRPFEAATREGLYRAIGADDPVSVSRRNRRVPADLDVVVQTALQKDRAHRYQTAEALADDLRAIAESRPIQARPISTWIRTLRWAQRNPAMAAMLGGLIVVLTAAVILTNLSAAETRRESARRKQALDEYDRLADRRRLSLLETRSEALWPLRASLRPDLEAWQEDFRSLLETRAAHRRALDDLRSRAISREGEHEFRFASETDAFRHEILTDLLREFDRVEQNERNASPWSVSGRLEKARALRRLSLESPRARRSWSKCLARLAASKVYRNVALEPIEGLLPLGPDPDSGMEEFLHVASHEQDWGAAEVSLPARPYHASYSDGIVFILLPGGTYWMGSSDDPTHPAFDPASRHKERPPLRITLAPYFLSKYETDRAQWFRLTGGEPSSFPLGHPLENGKKVDLRHPVENLNWVESRRWGHRYGLVLPTEAQWEFAAKGMRDARPLSLPEPGQPLPFNISGTEGERWFDEYDPGYSDGYACHSPVGRFPPGPLGFHDMAGNVLEWCRDGIYNYFDDPKPAP
ncbi:MAG: bifunctional serine/threonine-protein kinase/formylglycine-generating enzyme family protein, partial [Planctomycetota bacterium]